MREFKCHHVAAALLFGYKRASKTDIKCSWIKRPKSAPPKKTVTMAEMYPPNQPGYRALNRSVSDDDRTFIYKQLGQLGRFTALHWIMAEEPQTPDVPVPLLDDLMIHPEYLGAEDPRTWLRRQLLVSHEKVNQTAAATIGQRENALWAAVRKLRFTASNFGHILSAFDKKKLTVSLKKRLLSAYNLEKRAPVQWGVTHEQVCIAEYCKVGGVAVRPTGIWLHESGVLGASPDGFVEGVFRGLVHQQHGQATCSADIIEVKCPYTARDMTIQEACSSIKDFYLDQSSDGRLSLKQAHNYWHQIQGQLHITGTNTCDLVVWTNKDLQVIRIAKDHLWSVNLSKMIDFYFSSFLPSLYE
ncbi:uncharacterized protein LOC127881783 isoform X3 [Dreissena polymorpha]|nr:uncharacterized protein LOC127834894 isoform X3 [Dreissena polymorpha]XP_052216975.1 uncharacterized protein LOC127834894 isoform X3 [Dreissena polymorpha]XP_052250678.1 uncharacterized protein LOC127857942 isoform X3 [Dreissena polymorpha]XP_052250679.1 uncharacterized protein LOC127857942 isoform X3 [Dreissena polymorpha]XP_052253760.1 uncharacterized protein LOC127860033 isoform X3 [Dreissena polymorpha]XP_052253763.1 uncharacterized protein LOC127860033 isoform X3 [Dreissena polymorpha]